MKKNIVLLVILGCLFLGVHAQEFRVKPYLQYATKTSVRILFETEKPTTPIVRYGNALANATSPNLSLRMSDEGLKTMHGLELRDLEAETNYFWRVDIKMYSQVGNAGRSTPPSPDKIEHPQD